MVKLNFQKQPRGVFCKKEVLRNFAKFAGKHLCQSLFFNKVGTLFKKRLWHRCFPVNFGKFLRTPYFTEHLQTTASKCSNHLRNRKMASFFFNSNYLFQRTVWLWLVFFFFMWKLKTSYFLFHLFSQASYQTIKCSMSPPKRLI